MTELEKGPQGRRRGRGARERILSASQQLFREQGINRTGMDQLCAAAQVSKRTAYQHFTGKDELVAEYLRRFDPSVLPGVFDRTDLTPRERLLAAFDIPPSTPLCPYIAAAVELHDPQHPASQYARDYKKAVAARLADTAREAGAADPEQLGEQLALLIDGAAARTRVRNADAFPTAAAIAAVLIDNAIPATASDDRHGRTVGRLLPPEPGDEAINQAIADGILDAGDLAHARTAAQVARSTPEPTADPHDRPASDALAGLRADER